MLRRQKYALLRCKETSRFLWFYVRSHNHKEKDKNKLFEREV